MAERRILILGEGFSHDPHYGKTMRGIIRYGPDPVVAILDSQRAGAEHDGIPIVGNVEDALPFAPTVAVVGVATQGGRFPPAWRDLLKASIAAGSRRRERAARVRLRRPRAVGARADARRRVARPAQTAAGPERPDGREPRGRCDDRPHGRLRLRDRQEDGRRRARSGGAQPRARLGLRPDRPDRDRDRRLGDRSRRGRLRLPRRRRGVARRRGRAAWGQAALRRGPGLARAPAVLGRHARPRPRLDAARVRPLPRGRCDGDRRVVRVTPSRRSRS